MRPCRTSFRRHRYFLPERLEPLSRFGLRFRRAGRCSILVWLVRSRGLSWRCPLLFRLIGKLFGIPLDPNAPPNPLYMAAWIGLLVTSLNLMPVGQLDGGHGTFAVFGGRAHRIIGRIAFVTVVVLAILGFWWHNSPSGFLYAVLLGIMMKVPHPPPGVMEPLGTRRTIIALITLLVFALCFWPFPISIR